MSITRQELIRQSYLAGVALNSSVELTEKLCYGEQGKPLQVARNRARPEAKVENVLLAADGHVKIIDFGMSRDSIFYGEFSDCDWECIDTMRLTVTGKEWF